MSGFEDAIAAATAVATDTAQEIAESTGSSPLEDMTAMVADAASQVEGAFDVNRGSSSAGMSLLSTPLPQGNGMSIQTLNPQDMLDNILDFERRLTSPSPLESISDVAGDIAKKVDDWNDMMDGPDSDLQNLVDAFDGLKDVADHAVGYITADSALEREQHYQGMRIGLNKAVRNFGEIV
jgi:hypothetical protein